MPRRLSLVCCLALITGMFAIRPAAAVGTFAPAQHYPAFNQPGGLVAADFNNDGLEDMATATPNGIAYFPGNGSGAFGWQSFTFMMTGQAVDIATGDFNLNGEPDLVLATTSGLQVVTSNGNGAFFQGSNLLIGTSFNSVATGDVNGDGRTDAVATIANASQVVVFIHNGMGLAPGLTFPTGMGAQDVKLALVDNGPTLDVVTANSSSSVSVLLGTGTGSFGAPATTAVPSTAHAVDVANLNGDAFPDLAVANFPVMGSSGVTVLIGNGTGSFLSLGTFAAGSQPRDVTLADVDADGRVDAVVANLNSDSVSILLGTGSGSLGTPTNYVVNDGPWAVIATDLNGSGTIDVATANVYSKDVSVLLNSTLPGAPLNLVANAGPGQGQITLTWSPPSDDGGSPIQYYNIYRSTTPGNEQLVFVGFWGTTFTDAGLTSSTTYYYTVTATNAVGEGPWSNEAFATTFGPPTQPQNLSASPGTSVGEVKLTWQAPASDGGSPVTAYVVCRGTTPGVHAFCGTLPANATSFSDGGLLPLTSYYYVVHAVNALGQGAASSEACAKPFPWVSALGC